MDLNQLRAFVEVARQGNLTKASTQLCLSQPAISAKIKALEDEIGLRLFERLPYGMKVTAHGEILLDEANRTLAAASSLLSRARVVGASQPSSIRLGTIGEPIAVKFGEFLSTILVSCPNSILSITQGISGVIVDQVLAGELDGGIVVAAPSEQGLDVVNLTKVKLLIAGPIAWKAEIARANWEELGQFPWVGAPPKCSFSVITSDVFARHGINPKRVAEADQDHLLKSLVVSGLGLAILRADQAIAGAKAGELEIWPHADIESDLCYIQREDRRNDALNRLFVDILSGVWVDRAEPGFATQTA